MNKRVFCELLTSTHPPQLFDINSCNLLVNPTFLVRTHLKVYPELQSMSFSIPSKATIVLFFWKGRLSVQFATAMWDRKPIIETLVRICWNHHDAFLTPPGFLYNNWFEIMWYIILVILEAIYSYTIYDYSWCVCVCVCPKLDSYPNLKLGHLGVPFNSTNPA